MLTPSDLRKPSNESGYRFVRSASAGPNGGGKTVLWKTEFRRGDVHWRGPYRRTPAQAAQDYCDYRNNGRVPTLERLPTIQHKRPKRRPRPKQPVDIAVKRQEVRAWDREAAAAQPVTNHVYLMAVQGSREAVKIGESWDAHYRAADGQTWHWRPLVVLGFVATDIPRDADKPVHAMFAKHHIANEWFRPAQEVLSYFGVSNAAFFRKTATPRRQAA